MSRIRRAISYLQGLTTEQQGLLNILQRVAGDDERKRVEKAVRGDEKQITKKTLTAAGEKFVYPQVTGEQELNKQLREDAYERSYETFSKAAYEEICSMIAPNILGMDATKKAAALQLFAEDRIHILLLGDPGTGKTDILSSSDELSPVSSMGLGSGTTGAGLSVSYTKAGVQKGLLVLANNGICCIDELNLMKKDDQAALYNAMEKGFITYDKAGKHERFEADVRVLATANPKGDRFKGTDVKKLRNQLPFDAALLSRFHVVFLIRKPDKKQFLEITKKIIKDQKAAKKDPEYVQAYIKHAQKTKVSFPRHLEVLVSDAAQKIKEAEDKLLIEVSPRIINGIIGLSKASARMHLRSSVKPEDVRNALEILSESLDLKL